MPSATELKAADRPELGSAVREFRDVCEHCALESAKQQVSSARVAEKTLKLDVADFKTNMEMGMLHFFLKRKLSDKSAAEAREHFEGGH